MMTRHRWTSTCLLILAISFFSVQFASAQTPLSYSGTLPDADGIQRSVNFTGQLNGNVVSGTVTVEGNELGLAGTLAADGSVSCNVTLPNGESLGTFQAQAASDQTFTVSYMLGGRTGSLNAPVGSSLLGSQKANATSP